MRITVLLVLLLVLAACAPATRNIAETESEPVQPQEQVDPAFLLRSKWHLEAIHFPDGTILAPAEGEYSLDFKLENRVLVAADCNQGSGDYEADAGRLTFSPLVMTRVLCPPGSLYDDYVRELAAVEAFSLPEDRLRLVTAANVVLMFTPAAD